MDALLAEMDRGIPEFVADHPFLFQVGEDHTMPSGLYENSIDYHVPWTRCDGERDREQVWATSRGGWPGADQKNI
jgi:hypothetical protein